MNKVKNFLFLTCFTLVVATICHVVVGSLAVITKPEARQLEKLFLTKESDQLIFIGIVLFGSIWTYVYSTLNTKENQSISKTLSKR